MDIEKLKALVADDRVSRIRELIALREKIDSRQAKLDAERQALDTELEDLAGVPAAKNGNRAAQKCSKCGSDSHNARKCPRPTQ